jgi:hypothetical protein
LVDLVEEPLRFAHVFEDVGGKYDIEISTNRRRYAVIQIGLYEFIDTSPNARSFDDVDTRYCVPIATGVIGDMPARATEIEYSRRGHLCEPSKDTGMRARRVILELVELLCGRH